MKAKILFSLLTGGLLALAAWLVHVPDSAQAEVPEKYRETVHKGLEYLVKQQAKDGHWEGGDGQHPVAMTGLAGLALHLEAGTEGRDGRRLRIVPDGKYAADIRKAVDWLIAKSEAGRDGLIFSEHPSETARYMQGHGLATLFLAGASQDERDAVRQMKIAKVLGRAVTYILKAQSSQGGWYHTSKVEGHDFDSISPTVIQIQALQAAENAGIPIPSTTIGDAQEYLKKAIAKNEAAKQKRSRAADITAALACCWTSRGKSKDELSQKWFTFCEAEIPLGRDLPFGRDELIHYYYAQAQFNRGGDTWTTYRTSLFDRLQSNQNKDGSWPAGDGIGVGPVYSAALWCTVLQLDKRSHPSMRRPVEIITTTHKLGPRFAVRAGSVSDGFYPTVAFASGS